jgi:hypothetical protein
MAGTLCITSTILTLRRCSREGDYEAPSLFTPQNLLREARRQKGLPEDRVPVICVLDPDGDLVEFLQAADRTPPDGMVRSGCQWKGGAGMRHRRVGSSPVLACMAGAFATGSRA